MALLPTSLCPRRLFFTYVLPLIPLLLLWDGIVSCFRVYAGPEWETILAKADPEGRFEWRRGRLQLGWFPLHFPYVLGRPRGA